eukprot:366024-Chlamydomonas_euryale.AAC.25
MPAVEDSKAEAAAAEEPAAERALSLRPAALLHEHGLMGPLRSSLRLLRLAVRHRCCAGHWASGACSTRALHEHLQHVPTCVPADVPAGVPIQLRPGEKARPSQALSKKARPSQALPGQGQAKPSTVNKRPGQAKRCQIKARPSQALSKKARPSQALSKKARPSQALSSTGQAKPSAVNKRPGQANRCQE